MDKSTQAVPHGNTHSIFIKMPSANAPHEKPKWTEITSEKLIEIIDQLSNYKASPLLAKDDKQPGIINCDEKWDILILLDCNIPSSALCLLQPSVVTFVTYKMLGQDFQFSEASKFVESRNSYPRFVEELLSCSCVKRDSKFHELKTSNDCVDDRTSYTVFVGILDGSSSPDSYTKEAAVINNSLHIVEERINCSPDDEFPLSFWYVDGDTYLHLINLVDQKKQNIGKIRCSLDDEVAQSTAHKMPITWIIFYFKLYKLCLENKRSYAYYTEVFEKLWKAECNNYNENELKLALCFFHHLGVLFYFDSVEGMKDYIFTDCLWIFEKLQYLLSDFEDSQRDHNAKKTLKNEGHLLSKMIKHIIFEGPGEMKLQTFINVLNHLKYIAPLKQNDYFIPSILESHGSNPDVFKHYGHPQLHPLLITFSSGSLHRSVFCFLGAYMIQNLPKRWSRLKFKKRQHTFKDLITFSIDVDQYMCIIDKIFFLEIKLYSKFTNCSVYLHNSVFKFIENAMDAVCNELQLTPSDCKYGFICHECEVDSDDHMMIVKDYKDDNAYCCKTNDSKKLSNDHTVWFSEVCYKCIHMYMHTYIHMYIHAYIHTCKHTYIHIYVHKYKHTCIHTYMHAYMHTYIHTLKFKKLSRD